MQIIKRDKTSEDCYTILDNLTPFAYEPEAATRLQTLLQALDNPEKKVSIIKIVGTNYKKNTAHFLTQLLINEEFNTGIIFANHVLHIQERLLLNNKQLESHEFQDAFNHTIELAKQHKLNCTQYELVIATGLSIFAKKQVDAILIENFIDGHHDPLMQLPADILVITCVNPRDETKLETDLDQIAYNCIDFAPKQCFILTAEQSKLRLQKMKDYALQKNLEWLMPVRKTVDLPDTLGQIYGRYASLAERVAHIFTEKIKMKFSAFLRGNILTAQKGQRGRPSLQSRNLSERVPVRTMEEFWQENFKSEYCDFSVQQHANLNIVLDNADNLERLKNLCLALRLLNYKQPINEIFFIIDFTEHIEAQSAEVLKQIRYLFKKITGELILLCLNPKNNMLASVALAHAKNNNIRASMYRTLGEALDYVQQTANPSHSLICITGSGRIIKQYYKEIGQTKAIVQNIAQV